MFLVHSPGWPRPQYCFFIPQVDPIHNIAVICSADDNEAAFTYIHIADYDRHKIVGGYECKDLQKEHWADGHPSFIFLRIIVPCSNTSGGTNHWWTHLITCIYTRTNLFAVQRSPAIHCCDGHSEGRVFLHENCWRSGGRSLTMTLYIMSCSIWWYIYIIIYIFIYRYTIIYIYFFHMMVFIMILIQLL